MKRIVLRTLPSGEPKYVQPFHICIKGLETAILCRDEEDYDVFVKYIAICARRKNVIVIIYAVVSNHCHVAVLAATQAEADSFAQEVKKAYSQWFRTKYNEPKVLHGVDTQAICLDSEWYVRHALAYIPRNALDNNCPVHEYPWSGFRAMFLQGDRPSGKRVSALTKREISQVLHTRDKLVDVCWLLDGQQRLIPSSFCDTDYLEQAFNNDPAFWLRTIGSVNPAEMDEKLVDGPRRMLPDSNFFKVVDDTARRWFSSEIGALPPEKKFRLLPYIWRTRKTSIAQLARIFGLERATVKKVLRVQDSSE
jgi:Transposase IS200 like.